MENWRFMNEARQCLETAKRHPLSLEERRRMAIELAGLILREARRTQTSHEKSYLAELARMINDPIGKAFTTSMIDQCFRSRSTLRVADQLLYLLKKFGMPHFLSLGKRLQLASLQLAGRPLAKLAVPLIKRMLRKETSNLIIPNEPSELLKHIRQRRREGVRINLNHLGEAILGEEEAQHRLNIYLHDLANPEIEYISIKISSIYSQINLLGWKKNLNILSDRLKELFRQAKNAKPIPKFVNLDMEEYRDLDLTVELFQTVLE